MGPDAGRYVFAGIGALLSLVGALVAWPVLGVVLSEHPEGFLLGTIASMALAVISLGLAMVATGLTGTVGTQTTARTASGTRTSISVRTDSVLPSLALGVAAFAMLALVLLRVDAFRSSTPVAVALSLLVGWWAWKSWRGHSR